MTSRSLWWCDRCPVHPWPVPQLRGGGDDEVRHVVMNTHGSDSEGNDVSKQLFAAKPVTWRGRGDVLQCAWTNPLHGCWLVIDLWSGFGGLPLALLSLGVNFYCLAAESDAIAREACHRVMPNIVHVKAVEEVRGADFRLILTRRKPRGVILGGGSPCQGNSALNCNRAGLNDPRSLQPQELVRIRDELQQLPEMQDVELVSLLENVASIQKQYSEWMGCYPVLMDSVWCGWVRRKRLYWLVSSKGGLQMSCQPPESWPWMPGNGTIPELRFCGKKPVPAKVSWEAGFQPLVCPASIMAGDHQCSFHPFTREFYHPCDRVAKEAPATVARFFEDQRRFDNEAAAACLIRGGSKQEDVHLLAQYSQLLCHSLNARLWIEWIDSESNPSDGLSRLGISDPWTVLQGWQVQEYPYPDDLLPDRFLASFEHSLNAI